MQTSLAVVRIDKPRVKASAIAIDDGLARKSSSVVVLPIGIATGYGYCDTVGEVLKRSEKQTIDT